MNASISVGLQRRLLDVELEGVGDEEHVVLEVDVLVPLVRVERVLDREVVQAQLVGQLLQLLGRRRVDVDPHQLAGAGQQVRDGVEVDAGLDVGHLGPVRRVS